ncbi:PREDICTED: myosin-10-like [Chrysochloris asiatica]|uniref:Myosin-10-like n=1 Tax=Chrysochloris asiatica TaxID=185453 RepID=A0A9B0U8U7_CHRAS|nr:PREDICTED: myosin-10-like [Chrysochloris asiatica]
MHLPFSSRVFHTQSQLLAGDSCLSGFIRKGSGKSLWTVHGAHREQLGTEEGEKEFEDHSQDAEVAGSSHRQHRKKAMWKHLPPRRVKGVSQVLQLQHPDVGCAAQMHTQAQEVAQVAVDPSTPIGHARRWREGAARLRPEPRPKPRTYIGSIIVSVNPYKMIPDLYERTTMEQYSRHHLGDTSPHIFAIANECYRCLWKRHDNQCVLISGESGAGKTESTKLILKFLSVVSQQCLELPLKEKISCVEEAILESSPIMEAFGNAKTVYNSNSSRFGKFIQLSMSQKGTIQGGRVVDCILFVLGFFC